MKKFRVLGIISIIIIIAQIVGLFGDFSQGVSDGWNHAEQVKSDSISENPYKVSYAFVNVRQLENRDEQKVENSLFNKDIPYSISTINTYVEASTWHNILEMLTLPWAFAFLFGFYCLIRFLIDISKRQVFTDKNVYRIRWFAYSYIGGEFLMTLTSWLKEQAAVAQISLPGYELISNALTEADWISMIVIILFTEIFAVGTKIKEEQDLTI